MGPAFARHDAPVSYVVLKGELVVTSAHKGGWRSNTCTLQITQRQPEKGDHPIRMKLLGLEIDIPFKKTAEGIGHGLSYLFRGQFKDALKAVLKGISDDTTGQIVLGFCTGGGSFLATTAGLTFWRLVAGGVGLTVADVCGYLDTSDVKQAKLREQWARDAQQRGPQGGQYYPRFNVW
jgi:hypothetical protein